MLGTPIMYANGRCDAQLLARQKQMQIKQAKRKQLEERGTNGRAATQNTTQMLLEPTASSRRCRCEVTCRRKGHTPALDGESYAGKVLLR